MANAPSLNVDQLIQAHTAELGQLTLRRGDLQRQMAEIDTREAELRTIIATLGYVQQQAAQQLSAAAQGADPVQMPIQTA